MNYAARWILGTLFCIAGVLCFITVAILVIPPGYIRTAQTVTIDELLTGEIPESGYLEVTGGYVLPSYWVEQFANGDRTVSILPDTANLVDETGQTFWREKRTSDELSAVPKNALLLSIEGMPLTDIWPEIADSDGQIDPLELDPVQMTVAGSVEAFGDANEYRVIHLVRPPGTLLIFAMCLGAALLLLTFGVWLLRKPAQPEDDALPIYDGPYENVAHT